MIAIEHPIFKTIHLNLINWICFKLKKKLGLWFAKIIIKNYRECNPLFSVRFGINFGTIFEFRRPNNLYGFNLYLVELARKFWEIALFPTKYRTCNTSWGFFSSNSSIGNLSEAFRLLIRFYELDIFILCVIRWLANLPMTVDIRFTILLKTGDHSISINAANKHSNCFAQYVLHNNTIYYNKFGLGLPFIQFT